MKSIASLVLAGSLLFAASPVLTASSEASATAITSQAYAWGGKGGPNCTTTPSPCGSCPYRHSSEPCDDNPDFIDAFAQDAIQVQSGNDSTAVILNDADNGKNYGTIDTWGENADGQLGDGNYSTDYTPVTVTGITKATYIDDGDHFYIALIHGGTVQTWGNNDSGQLGIGTTGGPDGEKGYDTPQNPDLTGIAAVAAAAGEAYAVTKTGGYVYAWGNNGDGQLGLGPTMQAASYDTPQLIPGLSSVIAISAGDGYAVAETSSGSFWAWGLNNNDQLGLGVGMLSSYDTPQQVPFTPPEGVSVMQFSAGGNSQKDGHVLVLLSDNTVWGWGDNQEGQLADSRPSMALVPAPELLPNLSSITVTDVSAGGYHSMVIDNTGTIYGFGGNDQGQLGDATFNTTPNPIPTPLTSTPPTPTTWSLVSAGSLHTAAISSG